MSVMQSEAQINKLRTVLSESPTWPGLTPEQAIRLLKPPEAGAAEIMRDALFRVGRSPAPILLSACWKAEVIDVTILRNEILRVWSATDFPESGVGQKRWLAMFKATGYLSDGQPRPTEPLTVWRAAPVERVLGMAWTAEKQVAVNMAKRVARMPWSLPATVWQSTIRPGAVLARIDSRKEVEVVVNPRCLRGYASPVAVSPTHHRRPSPRF